jgi:hypothetical protein
MSTKRYMNWTGVSFTPQGGTLTAITGVSTVAIDNGGSLIKFSGDGDRFNTTVVNDFNEPSVTITTADLAIVNTWPVGTVGTVVATHNDAKNGVGTGAITYTLTNAVLSKRPLSGAHRQFGQGTITFECFSSDGVTNPLSTTIAT